jgi:radical SAM protein with 4Fe4S-binding SPASM domain
MFNVTKILCGLDQPMDALRYGHGAGAPQSARARRPVVVWNLSRTCNLKCMHCYSDSAAMKYDGELSFDEGCKLLDDLAAFGVPAVLMSGGEPLARKDTLQLAAHARSRGLKLTLSTNGTLIDKKTARSIKKLGFAYVGISLDGAGSTNDLFRGVTGAFDRAVRGIRNLKAVGQKVGLRLTLSPHTVADLDATFDFIEREGVERACFYHLVPAGRGKDTRQLSAAQTRAALDTIFRRTRELVAKGDPREILTVDNHADGPYAYLRLAEAGNPLAARAYELMRWNGGGGSSSGTGIADIDWLGEVHPDQFSRWISFGNVKQRPFSEIWSDESNPMLQALRNRKDHIEGRCRSCRFFDVCGGNFRARAYAMTGNVWASDPGCHLTDDEISVGNGQA